MSNKIPFTEPIGGKNQGNQNLNWAIDQNGNAFFAGDVRINGDLVADDITIDDLTMDSLTITGNASIGGNLTVTGTSTFTGAATFSTLTNQRVVYAGTSGVLSDDLAFTFDPGTNVLSVGSTGALHGGEIRLINPGGTGEYTSMTWSANESIIGTSSTGTARAMKIGTGGAQAFQVFTTNSVRLDLNATGTQLRPLPDNTMALGSTALRFSTILLGTSAIIGTTTTVGGSFSVTSGNVILSATTLGTTATSGFTWLPVCAGVPTGVPTGHNNTGAAPFVYNNSNGKLYVYSAGSWGLV